LKIKKKKIECGNRTFTDNLRIVGGTDAVPNSWPSQVLVRIQLELGPIAECSGTILNRRTVLTAAHCILPATKSFTLLFGIHDKSKPPTPIVQRTVTKVILHENFDVTKASNDIALLKFDEPLSLSESIYPACLPDDSLENELNPKAGEPMFAVGWGRTKEGGFSSDILQNVLISAIDDATCSSIYDNPPGSFCAGNLNGGQDTCQGNISFN
jgi:secreted trypsin-like serine protease